MSDWDGMDLMFRQVNPRHWDGKNPNSVAFFPTPKDEDQLSVDDARIFSAERSYQHFTEDLGFKSAGTWAISVDEIGEHADLSLYVSPIEGEEDAKKNNPAHCHVDLSKVSSKGQKKKRAQFLALKASDRGNQYQPPVA